MKLLINSASSAKDAAEKAGDIDLLVNCAGVALLEPFLETKVENFERTMDVNVKQVFIVSQVIAKNMIKRGVKGSIVNVSSQVQFSDISFNFRLPWLLFKIILRTALPKVL